MKSALLEIGVESLPARFLKPALEQLESKAAGILKEERLAFSSVKAYGTPMRLAVLVSGVPEKSETKELEVTGPPARLLKDAAGNFTPQAAGFARSQGVAPGDLEVVRLPKGEFLAARKVLPGEGAVQVLARAFPRLVAALEFPKTLHWEESRFRFGRPIRWLVALYGKRVVGFSVAGVRSGNKTRGLAALGSKPVAVPAPEGYVRLLRDQCVLVDLEERREALLKSLKSAAKRAAGTLDQDEELVEKVLCLTEHPAAVLGHFGKEYLELPAVFLSTVLKKQLMFFPILAADGSLAADFLGVRDGLSEGQADVQVGYERVLRARLSDARFFFRRDRETPLESKVPRLDRVTFQRGLGSMGQKVARVERLSGWLAERLLQDREIDGRAVAMIARLAYADLTTGVVGEFPELQGAMGGVYARLEGLDERVALGLEEFYYPTAAKAPLPTSLEGCLVSLAGKLDSVAAMIAGGFKPTGSEDPFALRRLGNGIIRILLEKQLPLSAREAAREALRLAAENGAEKPFDAEAALAEVCDFLWQRAETFFLEKGYPVDEVRAVSDGGLENLSETFRRLAAVHALRAEPDFVALAQAFKRASNIVKQANGAAETDVDQALFGEDAERDLYGALCRSEGRIRELASRGEFEQGLRSLVGLKPEVDRFFEKVLVMAPEEGVRRNRLSLLSRLVRLFKSVADISSLQG